MGRKARRGGARGEAQLLAEHHVWHDALVVGARDDERSLFEGAARFHSFFAGDASMERGHRIASGDERCAAVFLPKSNERQNYVFGAAGRGHERLYVVGPKKGGIGSARKRLLALYEQVQVIAYGHHAQLVEATGPKPDAIEEAAQLSEKRWDTGLGFEAISLPGTFAAGRLDEGTRVLLEAMGDHSFAGRCLDLASGSGVIGIALATRGGEWTLSDVDHLAVEASRRSAALAERPVTCIASDGFAALEGHFDYIVTNPPFHQGQATDLEVPRRFIRDAHLHLEPGGHLHLVANRFLPYESLITETFGSCTIVHEDKRFKVLSTRCAR